MKAGKPEMVGQKAIFLNMKEDGKKIRATRIESAKKYSRTQKHRNQSDW